MKRLTINIPEDRDKLYTVIRFPAGEIEVRLTGLGLERAKGKSEYTLEANPIPDLMELALLVNALSGLNNEWHLRALELPYLPYARNDRRFVKGGSAGLKVFGDFINSLNFTTIWVFDVHNYDAARYIENLVNLEPVHTYDQFTNIIKDIGKGGLALVLPDKGAEFRYDLGKFKLPVLVAEKVRDSTTGKLSGFKISPSIANYEKALIIDDICDGGGTFIGLAEEIRKTAIAIDLYLYVSHGIFSQGTQKLNNVFDEIYVSDFSYKFSDLNNWVKL